MPPRRRKGNFNEVSTEEKISKDLITCEKDTTKSSRLRPRSVKKTSVKSSAEKHRDIEVKNEILRSDDSIALKKQIVPRKKRSTNCRRSISNPPKNANNKCESKCSEVISETLNCPNNSKESSCYTSHAYISKELRIVVKKYEPISPCKKLKRDEITASSSSSESEWEEVADTIEDTLEDYKPNIPEGGVEITLGEPMLPRRHRQKFDVMEFIRCQVNRFKKRVQLSIHKVHILCLMSHGMYLNRILNSPDLTGMAFSLIPTKLLQAMKKPKVNIDLISKVVKYFRDIFYMDTNFVPLGVNLLQNLTSSFEMQKAHNASQYNIMFVVFARTLGLNVRLCYSLCPLSSKPRHLLKKPNKLNKSDGDSDVSNNTSLKSEKKDLVVNHSKNNDPKQKKDAPPRTSVASRKSVERRNSNGEQELNSAKSCGESPQTCNGKKKVTSRQEPKRKKKRVSYKISSEESMNDDESNDADFIAKDESDSDFMDANPRSNLRKKKSPKAKGKTQDTVRQPKAKNRKILSSSSSSSSSDDDDDDVQVWYWAEVYSKVEKKWVSVESSTNVIDKPYGIEELNSHPISYVIAFDSKSHLKDVTKRYCSRWLTHSRKLRVDPEWWEETLEPFLSPSNKLDKEEEDQMEDVLCSKPLPTKISEYKNHPLYALSRHLLKFEAIYPPDAPSLGFIRNEPVYARECVHTLRSRETWNKEARVVRVGEEAYKVVKRCKWDKVNRKILKDVPLDIFGHWQTEEFVPPIARDGIVPKNEYGNVELFKPCMLPKGTVHLQLSGLNRIARKLEIDCCPALVGFDIHKLGIHPVFDGWIVCEEFKETLEEAWHEEQINIRKREEEKREKRIYGNWKKLIKGLLIKERIKVKYAIQ